MEGTNIVQKFVEIFPPVASALFTGREAWEVKGLVARPGSQGRDDVSLPDFIPWEPGTSYRFCRTEVHFSLMA